MQEEDIRPDPDQLLLQVGQDEETTMGKLRVFFGYAAGVGKTYGMLKEAIEQQETGKVVLAGYVEPHARPETMALLDHLNQLPSKKIPYKNMMLEEFDLDEALRLQPEIILVDELAHTNALGSRNKKRYQDIEELLQAGIDVYTTVNVQHIESLNDIVEDITHVRVHETVPDSFFDEALIKLIDVEPDELLGRLKEGKIYRPEHAKKAMNHFFTKENLKLLREIAIRRAADHIGMDNRIEEAYTEKRAHVKLLTCIDSEHQTGAEKCIRWTARLANAFRAEWVVLHVDESGDNEKSEAELALLKRNNELAERLGAEVVTLSGHNPVTTIAQYAKLTGVTDIIIGKHRRKLDYQRLLKDDIEDRLIKHLSNVELHIVPFIEKYPRIKNRFFSKERLIPKNLTIADSLKTMMLLLMATLLSEIFSFLGIGDQNVIVVYLLFILIISQVTTGYFYGVLSSIISVIFFNWFFVDPLFSLTVYKAGYPITLLIMLMVALFTSNMMIRVKSQARESIKKEHQMGVLYDFNKKLLATRNLNGIINLTNDYLVSTMNHSVIFYTEQGKNLLNHKALAFENKQDIEVLTGSDEEAVANWVFNNQKVAGYGTDTLMGAKGFYLPVLSQGRVLAVIGVLLSKENPLTHENLNFLKLIASQLSLALERQYLVTEQQQIMLETEKEKMRSNLLRAISHDLRTPLTGILGASSAILENKDKFDEELKLSLIKDIKEDSEWLIRMVENLLSVTRIDEGTMKVKKMPEAVEEIVAGAVRRIRKRFKEQELIVKVPDEFLLVPMDGTLIEQVLINLMENAIKHSGSKGAISVIVKRNRNKAIFEVTDNGIGIPEKKLASLFDQFGKESDTPIDATRGMGIGLSICKTIVAAHSGTIEVTNKQQGGAVFRFTLPID